MLQMSKYNQQTCHIPTYPFLHPLNGIGPGQTEGYNLFSLSKLATTTQPKANWSHFETGPALVRTASTRQQLSFTFRERWKSHDTQVPGNRSQA